MVDRGRSMIGERHPLARLTESAVLDIRDSYARGETQTVLAARYGVHQTTLHAVVHGRIWRHVGGPTVTRRMNERLTDAQVDAIRLRHSLGVIGPSKRAKMYRVSRETIWRIAHGTQRRHRRAVAPEPHAATPAGVVPSSASSAPMKSLVIETS